MKRPSAPKDYVGDYLLRVIATQPEPLRSVKFMTTLQVVMRCGGNILLLALACLSLGFAILLNITGSIYTNGVTSSDRWISILGLLVGIAFLSIPLLGTLNVQQALRVGICTSAEVLSVKFSEDATVNALYNSQATGELLITLASDVVRSEFAIDRPITRLITVGCQLDVLVDPVKKRLIEIVRVRSSN